jgi:Phenylpropionate dioxygenase and related ring-hydroxylating dioxygenases, large terminal subunit
MIMNQWYAVLPSKAVKKGQVTGVKRLNLELAFFRGEDGMLGCVADQCTHRGAALSKGKVKGNCVECPFHGIQFDEEGRCTLIPANGRASKLDLSRYNVKKYLVKEHCSIIYLWYGDETKATEKLPFFDEDVDDSWVYSEIEDLWNSHYSRCIENQLDVVHLPFIHHNTIGRGNKTIVNGPKIELFDGGLLTSANNSLDEGQAPLSADQCEIKPTYLKFLFPNIWMNHISDKMKVIIYFAPVDDENTILYIRFYSRVAGNRPIDAIVAWLGKFGNRVIERQDKRIVITQKPKASSYRSAEKLVAGDSPIIQYRRMREELQQKPNE